MTPFSVPDYLSTSDLQSEVGEVFGEIGGELPAAKFGRRFLSFFCWENRQKHFPPKLHRKFHHQTSLRGSGLWRALIIRRRITGQQSGKERRHKHKQIPGIVAGLGGCQNFVYVFFCSGHFLMGEKNT